MGRAGWGLALGVAAVSFAAVLIKLCSLHPLTIAAWRLGLAALVFAAATAVCRSPASRERCPPMPWPWKGWAFLAGFCLAVHFASWIASLKLTSVASSVVLVTTNPIFVGLGSAWWLREQVSRRLWAGIALTVAGGLVIALGDRGAPGPDPLLGDLLALLGAVAGSAYLLVGRRTREETGLLPYVTAVYSSAAAWLVGFALVAGAPLAGPFSARDLGLLALIALLPQVVGHTLINWSLRFLAAGLVAVAILGEPVGASVLAWAVLGEPVGPAQLAGGSLILLGVGLASWPAQSVGVSRRVR
ncbi:MAG: DMT family transporter [Candidatus Eremiobacterota bacterium]